MAENFANGACSRKERYRARCAAMLFLLRRNESGGQEILLQKRQNTGYADGMWDTAAAGHGEEGEPLTETLIREAREELGIEILPEHVRFATFTYKPEYCNGFFAVERWKGEPRICEPEKCGEIRWFPLAALPDTLLDDRRAAIQNFLEGVPYSEYGWSKRS